MMSISKVGDSDREELLKMVASQAYENRQVTLSSGRSSDYYMDCRRVTLHPKGARLCGRVIWNLINEELLKKDAAVDGIGGPTLGADPIVTSVQLSALDDEKTLPGFLVRKQAKEHGMASRVEGRRNFEGDRLSVVLLEDVLTTGKSLLEASEAVSEAGLKPIACVVLVDRDEGGREAIKKAGLPIFSVFKASDVAEAHKALK